MNAFICLQQQSASKCCLLGHTRVPVSIPRPRADRKPAKVCLHVLPPTTAASAGRNVRVLHLTSAFVMPSALRLSAAVAPSARLLYSGQQGRRVVTMAAEGLPPGDHNNNDPLDAQSSIPDRVGSAAIRRRIDSIKRSRGAGKRTPRQDESIRWVASTESGHRARSTLLPRAVWVLLFNQGSGPFSSSSEPQRGLYCLWSKGTNSALAFEEREGALRYAFKLKEKGLGIPRPTRVSMTDLQRFCLDHSFGIWMIPANVVPEAPRKTKKDLGFDPLNLASSPHGGRGAREEEGSVLTPDDIRKWRAKFERLYAQE